MRPAQVNISAMAKLRKSVRGPTVLECSFTVTAGGLSLYKSAVGDRPTWQFKASKFSREAAGAAHGFGKGEGYADPFSLFGAGARPKPKAEPANARRLGKLERNALADLDLDEDADGPAIRARYIELVKHTHPDSNGGDRSAEHKLQRVIKAYQVLKKAKMA